MTNKARESRVRRKAKRLGYVVTKSRWRVGTYDNCGGYAIVDPDTGGLVAGFRYDLEIDDVEAWLNGPDEQEAA